MLISLALAGDDGVRLAARGIGVALADEQIGALYRGTWFTGAGAVTVPVRERWSLDIELSYKRMAGATRVEDSLAVSSTEADLELVPLTAVGLYELPLGRGDLYAGGGWSAVSFRQYDVTASDEVPSGQIAGAKLCPELRVGARLETGLVQAPLAPVAGPVAEALEVELYGARRVQLSRSRDGFDLSAWRFAAGVAVRF